MSTLSRMYVNPQKRGARKLLTNPQAMHAAVRSAFPPDIDQSSARVLWRVDSSETAHTLYLTGPEAPDLDHLVDQAGWATRPGDTADMTPFLDALRLGQEWSFRLTANPVSSIAGARGERGKLVGHVTPAQQMRWLLDRAERNGFELRQAEDGDPDVAVTRREHLSFSKSDLTRMPGAPATGRRVTLRTARFEGSLRVTDVEALRRTLRQGIGRGRAYGCGLLSLARPGR